MKPDLTAAERMKRWRANLRSEGWEQICIWLPPQSSKRLAEVVKQAKGSRRDTLTEMLEAGIAVMSEARNSVTKPRNYVTPAKRKDVTEQRKHVTHTERKNVTRPPRAERDKYRKTILVMIDEMEKSGLSHPEIARQLNDRGVRTLYGRGPWNTNMVQKIAAKYLRQ